MIQGLSRSGSRSRFVLKLVLVCFCIALIPAAFVFGYYGHKLEINPMHRILSRIDAKIDKLSGEPNPTEKLVSVIETTFLRLRGRVYEIPDNDYVNGGAMTVWGDDLLVMNHAGKIFVFEPDGGLVASRISPPENGMADYILLSKTEKYKDYDHRPSKIRYNDITYIETAGLRGLATSFTFFDATGECYGTRVAWLDLPETVSNPREFEAAATDWRSVFDTSPCLPLNPDGYALDGMTAGGRMAFQAPSTLYLGSGDYGLDGIAAKDLGLQSDDNTYGKVIAIDLISGEARVVSKGHRNLQGMTIDAEGRLWATEHGERGGDELNLIKPGVNYGWPLQSLGTRYSGQPLPTIGTYGRHDLFQQPVFAWLPSAAVSALMTIHGIDPSWDGDLLAGSLSSPEFGQSLWHIRIEGERVVFVERIELGRRVRYLTQYGDSIAAWLDTNELVILTPEKREDPLKRLAGLVAEKYEAAMADRVMGILQSCNECHSFVENEQRSAPSLHGVVGRRIGGGLFDSYSAGLQAVGGIWDRDKLAGFLMDPNAFAPDTAMPDPGLGDAAMIEAVIWALEQSDSGAADLTYN